LPFSPITPVADASLRRDGVAAAAWAARRAAAMKSGFTAASATAGLATPTAASEAAMRSAAEGSWRARPMAEPGSSG
jgi:hypothetical protein